MVSKPVKQGTVGVSRSTLDTCILLQVTDDACQSRAVLTIEQAHELIERLQKEISALQDKTVWYCIVCEKPMKIIGNEGSADPATWPNVEGGTISIDFGYGSIYDQMNMEEHREVQTCICDECFKQKRNLTREVTVKKVTKWEIEN